MKLIAIALLAVATICSSQSAKVIQLDPGDAAEAASLDAEMKALVARQEAFHKSVVEKYLVTKDRRFGGYPYESSNLLTAVDGLIFCTIGSPCHEPTPQEKAAAEKVRKEEEAKRRWIKMGWDYGEFVYSEDFKFIVPKPTTPISSFTIGGCNQYPLFGPANTLTGCPYCNLVYSSGDMIAAPQNEGYHLRHGTIVDLPPSIGGAYGAK